MMKTNPSRKLNRLQFGKLLSEAWGLYATVKNAVSAFSSAGIVPFNPEAIRDYAFLTQTVLAARPENNVKSTRSPGVSTTHLPASPQPGPSVLRERSNNVDQDDLTP
uniref:Uncharacterized protein n=1 Tax=Photinus pyralis TaxID=7054 RepID=A0A1Y1L522_PHOPY